MWKVDFQLRRHSAPIQCVDVSPDILYMASASTDGSVGYTNLLTRHTEILHGHQDPVLAVAFSPSAANLVSTSNDGSAVLWNCASREKITTFRAHQLPVRSVCWSPDGKFIATGSSDQTTVIWSLNHFTKRQVLSGLKGWVRDVKWVDNTIAVGGNDSSILLFDSRTGKIALSIPTNTGADIMSLSLHEQRACLASGASDQMIRIWDLRTGDLLQRHSAHTAPVTRVAFIPYGDDLLSAGKDGVARLWNLKSATCSACFRQHEAGILGLCWLPSARGFVTSGEDRRICVFRLGETERNANSWEFEGGNVTVALGRLQNELTAVVTTMQALDRRLLLQEEKIQWLSDIEEPIRKASSRE
jgi:WD40 repeat protein